MREKISLCRIILKCFIINRYIFLLSKPNTCLQTRFIFIQGRFMSTISSSYLKCSYVKSTGRIWILTSKNKSSFMISKSNHSLNSKSRTIINSNKQISSWSFTKYLFQKIIRLGHIQILQCFYCF